jgi:hypothetical protein
MAVKLVLKGAPKPNSPAYGLHGLDTRMKGNTAAQYVIMRVRPVEDLKRRGDTEAVTTVMIDSIEGMVDGDDVEAAATLMERATRSRHRRDRKPKHDQAEMDLDGTPQEAADQVIGHAREAFDDL